MLPMNWHKALSLFLWITPHILLGVLAVVLCKRRLYREFPCLFAYVLYEIAEFILMFTLYSMPSVTGEQYTHAYYATLTLSIALRFGVIDEVSKELFRESQFLRVSARRALQGVTGLLLVMGLLLAVCAPGDSSARCYCRRIRRQPGSGIGSMRLAPFLVALFPLLRAVLASLRIRDRAGSWES